ncbi:hypothetical protein [Pseudoxanthomonas suwonensis]|uniref:hypothetical protein n=1 Tax=Pseudoxanthomonas suwonensis TaxID=314722 RepID=UPI00138F5E14|nr:hypothetical protein [Pseudoxanthomonas suwonensis]KAF1703047.1 hypothetical protein CSC68_05025 [Pseudoxanthomonas suwonensis]
MSKVPLKITFLALSAVLAGAACSGEPTPADMAVPAAAAATPTGDAADADATGGPAPDQEVQLVQFGASMYAAAEFCKLDYDVNTRRTMREQQKQATVAQGRMSAAQFDAVFDAHSAKVKASLVAMPQAERAKTCAQLERIGKPAAG